MYERSHLLKKLWWMGCIAMLILLFARAAPHAHAQGALLDIKLLRPAPRIVCIGHSVEYTVEFRRTDPLEPGDSPEHTLRPIFAGDSIEAESSDAGVGAFTNSRIHMTNSPSPELIRPGMVVFTFKGKKIGRTTLTFSGTAPGSVVNSVALVVT